MNHWAVGNNQLFRYAFLKYHVAARACFSVYKYIGQYTSNTRMHMPMEVPKVELGQKDAKASLPQGGKYNFVIRVFQASP